MHERIYVSFVISRHLKILVARLPNLDSSSVEAEWDLVVDDMGGGEIVPSGGNLGPILWDLCIKKNPSCCYYL